MKTQISPPPIPSPSSSKEAVVEVPAWRVRACRNINALVALPTNQMLLRTLVVDNKALQNFTVQYSFFPRRSNI